MMTWIILLLALALVAVIFEVLIPGGFLGGFALICFLGAAVLIGMEEGVVVAVLSLMGMAVLVILVVVLEVKILGRGPWRKKFFLESSIHGASQNDVGSDDLTGKAGRTVTALSPTGMVEVEGKRLEAFSQSGFLEKDLAVTITGHDNFRILVRK